MSDIIIYILGVIIIPLFFYLLYKIDHIEGIMISLLLAANELKAWVKEEVRRK